MRLHVIADLGPVELSTTLELHDFATLSLEEVDGVLREDVAVPLRSLIGRVRAALLRELRGAKDRVVRDDLHALVGEVERLGRVELDVQAVERVMVAADAEAYRTMAGVA